MKKLLLILLPLILFLVSCGGGGSDDLQPIDPPTLTLEETLVGKKWCLSNEDEDGFILSANGEFLTTKKCISNDTLGMWILDSNLIKYSYIDNSIQTTVLWGEITEYSINEVKILINNNSTSTSEAIYSPTAEDVYGCMDSLAFNYNPLATCDDNLCSGYQMTYIPDNNFEQRLIDLGYDDILDDSVKTSNISSIGGLGFGNSHRVNDFTGLEDFISLTSLVFAFDYVQNININNCVSLKSINFNRNIFLESIQINNCPNLEDLVITQQGLSENEIKLNSFSIYNCPSLKDLEIRFTKITNLNLSNYINLETLYCVDNQLTTIDVSNCSNLETLTCSNNQLTSLDVSNCSNLKTFSCPHNQLTSLDVSSCSNLENYNVGYNQLTTLDVSSCSNLEVLTCGFNQLTSLGVSSNSALYYLYCANNQITHLNLQNGNNTLFSGINSENNPQLSCIRVDDEIWSNNNWLTSGSFIFDPQHYFSEDCP